MEKLEKIEPETSETYINNKKKYSNLTPSEIYSKLLYTSPPKVTPQSKQKREYAVPKPSKNIPKFEALPTPQSQHININTAMSQVSIPKKETKKVETPIDDDDLNVDLDGIINSDPERQPKIVKEATKPEVDKLKNKSEKTEIKKSSDYPSDDDAIDTIDTLQTTYQCCGVNLWLDWARVDLGVTNSISLGRRRRQYSSPPVSPLTRALRQKRQDLTSGYSIYNLPSSYSVTLPLSCCTSGGTTIGNSLGGYCVFNANNGSSSFYVSGCLEPVSNIGEYSFLLLFLFLKYLCATAQATATR